MIGLVEALATQGRWLVLALHEINGSRLTAGSHDFRMLLDCLARRADEVWTAPTGEVAARIARGRPNAATMPPVWPREPVCH